MDNELLGPIIRAFRLVEVLSDSSAPLTGKELSEKLELPPSTVHRLLQLLLKAEIVERVEDGQRYAPGPGLFRIAFATIRKSDLTARAMPFVQDIVSKLDMTSMFWTLVRNKRLLIPTTKILSSHNLDFQDSSFVPRGLAWGCVGRSVLAFLSEAEITEVVANAGSSPTGRKIESLRTLKAQLAEIRATGIATSSEQTIKEAVGFAAPVFNHAGEVVGCFGTTVPKMRYDPNDQPRIFQTLKAAGEGLSAELGYKPGM